MPQDLASFVGWLRSRERRLALSDGELLEVFWQAHPRLRFFKSLPWGCNVLDIGAGNGGLAHWRGWLKPDRADLSLYGVDRNAGEYRELYAGWETVDLDRKMPEFPGVAFDGTLVSHLIEYLAAPESLIAWLGERAAPGARVYFEWTGPGARELPTREQLKQHGIEVLTSNFMDDREHEQAPELARMGEWLADSGFEVVASGAVDLGLLGEELFARGADRDARSMGYWSLTRSSLYMLAIKSEEAIAAATNKRRAQGIASPTVEARGAPATPAAGTGDKQTLVRELGIEQGFARYKELSGHAASDVIKRKRIASLYDFAREHGGALHDLDDELHGVSVACLIDARVRSGSGIVEVGDAALVDVADSEALRLGAELARDPAVFHAEADAVWLITNGDPDNPVELEDGFMLLGQPGGAFRDWMPQAVARYVAAKTSGALPPVPVLIDGRITANERETAQRMLPTDTNLVQLSPHAVTQVRRLWCAPRCLRTFSGLESYVRVSESVPGFARREEAWELARGSFVLPPNAVIVEIGAFMGSGTILLAGARKLRGSGRVHAIDPFDGSGEPFSVPVYQRMLGEAGGGSLRGHFERNLNNADVASWVEVHQGRATEIAARWTTPVDMIFLDGDQSRTGVREAYDSWAPFLKPGGTIIVHNSAPGHRPEQDGSRILVEEEIRPPSYDDIRLMHSMTVARNDGPPAPRLFSYWDQPDLTPVQPTLDDWQAHFPEFTIFGDPDVEPIIEELFPEHPELFRNIRIPTCKSDLALLLLLYKHGGLYVDCHCGVRDPVAIRELLTALDRWELILYDKSRREAPRPDTALDPLNSVMFARPRSPIILRALNTALANLTAHRLAETEHGFRRYHIASLSGPGVLNDTLFVDPESLIAELKPEFSGRARFIPEGDAEPIGRYMHYEYRQPGMHWSERQQHELLFRLSEEPQSGAPVPPLARGSPTKVSVLLLAYNQARFVAEALDSVLMQQTKFNFEILAVDDASVDGTANIILEYARKYPTKIRLILRPFNLGSERASFLDSYQRAKGEYVALLDGDDYWTDARKLQKQVAFMDSNREYSCCGHKNIMLDEWNKTEWVKAGPAHDTDVPIEELICGNPFHTSSILYRNGLVSCWPVYFNDFEFSDWPLEILLAQRGKLRFMADIMSAYRIHSGGTWSQKYRDRGSPGQTNEAGWTVILNFWKVLNHHFNNVYESHIEQLIKSKSQELTKKSGCNSETGQSKEDPLVDYAGSRN